MNASAPPIPLLDLKQQHAALRPQMDAAMARVVDQCQFVLGPEVKALESELASYLQAAHAIGVASGTDALILALKALDIGPGDEVITTPFTFFATAETIALVGATPVFADIDPVTFNLDPKAVEAKITPRTRAIIPVHLFGLPADMDAFLELGRRHNVRIIEDAAQAAGARYKGRPVGALGDVGCFSFYPTKNLGGVGDGGLMAIQDATLAARVRQFANHGQPPGQKYFYDGLGTNSRLDSLQAAVLRVKLPHLDAWNARRRAIAAQYRRLLSGCDVVCPPEPADRDAVHHLYTVRHPERDRLMEHLRACGIGCMVYYPLSLHLQPAFAHLGYRRGDLPHSEAAQDQVLSLPMYAELTDAEVERVCAAVLQGCGRGAGAASSSLC
ncbi:MAG: DegT/DnrJ/EryC1/StrS family aminotransferase [Candidatus Xenobia bacterium]